MKGKRLVVTVALGMLVLVLLTGCGNLSPVASFTCSPSSGEAPLSVSFDASASSAILMAPSLRTFGALGMVRVGQVLPQATLTPYLAPTQFN